MLQNLLQHLFIPHQRNGHRAGLLHHLSLILLLGLLFAGQSLAIFSKKNYSDILGIATDINVEKLLAETNKQRLQAGLGELMLSAELSRAAYAKANDMIEKNYWAHYSPTGKTPWNFIVDADYSYAYAGENLAKDFQASSSVVDAWMNSPTHRANILRPEYKDIGFAIVNGRLGNDETTLVVQMFGTKTASGELVSGVSLPVQAGMMVKKNPLIDSVRLMRFLSLFFAGILFIVFITDGLYLARGYFRSSGHNLAHLIFLGSLIGVIWFAGLGAIL